MHKTKLIPFLCSIYFGDWFGATQYNAPLQQQFVVAISIHSSSKQLVFIYAWMNENAVFYGKRKTTPQTKFHLSNSHDDTTTHPNLNQQQPGVLVIHKMAKRRRQFVCSLILLQDLSNFSTWCVVFQVRTKKETKWLQPRLEFNEWANVAIGQKERKKQILFPVPKEE